ncbi:MAG: redoxin domain-containing protein [Candidatus Moranbacteria bacterium]|nr:redoxin domain-containing protein [Candidatus Moranbacteria bacterium]NTW75351.1 redoxin domain-containing protein [Candidatus Moranbacteria bacterium]
MSCSTCDESNRTECDCKSNDCFGEDLFFPLIGEEIPDFGGDIFHEETFKKVRLSDYRGKWLILFFYPADFTFVCPTELEDLAESYATFQELGAEILSVSTDTVYVHKAWHDHSDAVRKVTYPMFADPTGELCRTFGTYIEDEGISLRGTFVIDPDGVLQSVEMNSNAIGRNSSELLRKLRAAQFVREHGGEVCPAKWRKAGDETLIPGINLVGKI